MKLFTIASWVALALPGLSSAAEMRITARDLDALRALPIGATRLMHAMPVAKNTAGDVRLERIDVYAPGARLVVDDGETRREVPRSAWLTFVSHAGDVGSARLALAIAPDGSAAQGALFSDDGRSYTVSGRRVGDDLVLATDDEAEKAIADARTCALGDAVTPAALLARPDDSERGTRAESPATPDVATHTAVVAVDTDGEFMTLRFADNTTQASNYLAALFAAMTVTYERDFDLRLLQGTTVLRTGGGAADPYGSTPSTPILDQLDELGEWWAENQGTESRAFVILLSGKLAAGPTGGFSGLAWIGGGGNYCTSRGSVFGGCGDGQCTSGHYSANRTWTNTINLQSFEPIGIGHELGHNFGARHAHCSDAVTGIGQTGVNTIDTCYASESGCYSGPTSCPAPHPVNDVPNVRGTIMSYCHNLGGCSSAGVFADGHRTLLTPRVAANVANGCFAPIGSGGPDPVFKNGFE